MRRVGLLYSGNGLLRLARGGGGNNVRGVRRGMGVLEGALGSTQSCVFPLKSLVRL